MNAHRVGCLVFLMLMKSFLCQDKNPFTIDKTEQEKNVTEGSCVEIKCNVATMSHNDGAVWYWIKDAKWHNNNYTGTIVYSTDASKWSEDFKSRVKYIPQDGNDKELYSIQICEVSKNDTGTYMFRFEKNNIRWATEPRINVTVLDNPCPITFEKPPVVQENATVKLNCYTSASCSSNLQLETSKQPRNAHENSSSKRIIFTFKATWQDDGTGFSCKTEGNSDKYLIKNVTVTVEYAPRDVEAHVNYSIDPIVREGETVILECSARGQPKPDFAWFKDDQQQSTGAIRRIVSIQEAQSGSYNCRAKNKLGERSSTVNVVVIHKPQVVVQMSQEDGARVTFLCKVMKSSPQPHAFIWFKDKTRLKSDSRYHIQNNSLVIAPVQPEDRGWYQCEATNTVGTGESTTLFEVNYKPRNTRISLQNMEGTHVRLNNRLTMTCETDAHPTPWFSWYRYQQTESSKLTFMSNQKSLTLDKVQRADEACYTCNTTNSIDTGDVSEPLCIRVLFPPTSIVLSMAAEVAEGELVTVNCSVESFPSSQFTLTKSFGSTLSKTSFPTQNFLRHRFNATLTDAAEYTCDASNSEGKAWSTSKKLVVKYAPKNVQVNVRPSLEVKENKPFKMDCVAESHPPVTSVTWMKETYGEGESVWKTGSPVFVKSPEPSDSGFYSCKATNEMGTQSSQQVEIKVHYGPKHTKIIEGEKHQLPDGTTVVLLSCFAHCYPHVKQYSWYKKADDESGDRKVSDRQNISVSAHEPGEYYCVAENDMSQRRSDPILLFNSKVMKIVKFFSIFCLILILLALIFFWHRYRGNKSIQQILPNTWPCCGFLARWETSGGSNQMNDNALIGPSRSRDDLLPQQSHPDSMPASDINNVYSHLDLPQGKPAPSAQRPAQADEDSLNYWHFEEKNWKPREEAVYARVSKSKQNAPSEKRHEKVEEYENVACADKRSPPSDYDTDTSEDEVEVTYSQVNFKPKARHQRRKRDSSTSEESTEYSELNL
ncbi:unnamed protein product [Ophioblennius macclurei]